MAGVSEEEVEKYLLDEIKKSLGEESRGKEKKPAKPEPVIVLEAKVKKKEAGQKLFSEVFGFMPKTRPDFPVTVFREKDWDDKVQMFIPALADPELDGYEPQKEAVEQLVSGLEEGDRVSISGPTGSGKSSMVKYCCQKLCRPFVRVNMNGDIESSALFGQLVVESGATVWKDGPATEAIKYGAVLCVDEWTVMPPEITMGFQNPLERGGFLFLKEKPGASTDKVVQPHQHTRYVFCDNTTGQGDDTGAFAGTNVQNTATIDRFDMAIHLDYLGEDHEMAVIMSKVPELNKDVAKKMIQYAGQLRIAYSKTELGLTMSPRTLINWGRKIQQYGAVKTALTYCFLNKLRDSDKKLSTELYTRVFGSIK